MGNNSTVCYRLLTSGNTFEEFHSALELFVTFHINQIRRRAPVLCNQNRFFVPCEFSKQIRGFPLECCDQFSFHEVIVK